MARRTPGDQAVLRLAGFLQRNQPQRVLTEGPDALRAAAGRPRLRARIHAWMAQAYWMQGDIANASQALKRAQAIAGANQDVAGMKALVQLEDTLRHPRVAEDAPISPARVLPESLRQPEASPLAHAVTALQQGNTTLAEEIADRALAAAIGQKEPKQQVVALLILAQLEHRQTAALEQAAQVADALQDMNLVTAVSKAAKSVGYQFPQKVFFPKNG